MTEQIPKEIEINGQKYVAKYYVRTEREKLVRRLQTIVSSWIAEFSAFLVDLKVLEERVCGGCNAKLTRDDILNSQGWHCKRCFKVMCEEPAK